MINVAIIGYGMSAQTFHLPLITALPEQYRLTAIVSSQTDLNLSAHPHAKRYPSVEQMLTHSNAHLVINTTPNHHHYPLSELCLKADKHVVIEKPMTLTLEEAQHLIELSQHHNRLLSVFHNRRLDSDFLTLKKLIHDNVFGEIYSFQSHWNRHRPHVRPRWREQNQTGGGIWYDLGPHLIDQALCLFGLPEAVDASFYALRPNSPTTDYAHVQLHYPNRHILLHTSPYHIAPTLRFHIEGAHAHYQKHHLDPQETQLKDGLSPHHPQFGHEPPEHYGHLYTEDGQTHIIPSERGQFLSYYQNLAAAINAQQPLLIPPEEALNVMRVLTLAIESAKQQRRLSLTPS